MIKAKVSTDYKDIERIFAGGSIQKEILKVWSTEVDAYVFESWRILEMEGLLPLTIKANGEPLIDYRIYGNTVQNDTPTPENPITPIGCGVRTENLFDGAAAYGVMYRGGVITGQAADINNIKNKVTADMIGKTYTISITPLRIVSRAFITITINGTAYWRENELTVNQKSSFKFAPVTENDQWYITYDVGGVCSYKDIMVNEGSTALPYEPYGYKLPILSNSTVTNIYLGEVETTRMIKKLVLTGEENWLRQKPEHTNCINLYTAIRNAKSESMIMSNVVTYSNIAGINNDSLVNVGRINDAGTYLLMDFELSKFSTLSAWKTYLQQQYAAGTPVTVWYVLAEPKTGIVNEPLMKIGNYADTIDSTQANVQIPTHKGTTVIDYDGEDHFITSDGYELVDKNQNGFLLSGSTLRPSKMYIKYKGR